MKNVLLSIVTASFILTGCGGSNTTTASSDESNRGVISENIAKDNALNKVESEFNGYTLVVESNATIGSEPSMSTKGIYGEINGQGTTSLLTINDHYKDGDTFVVKVLKDGKVVGVSDSKVLYGESLDFGNIVTGEK